VEDTPDDLIHDLFAAQLWEGHPLGRPILGTREAVTVTIARRCSPTSARSTCRHAS